MGMTGPEHISSNLSSGVDPQSVAHLPIAETSQRRGWKHLKKEGMGWLAAHGSCSMHMCRSWSVERFKHPFMVTLYLCKVDSVQGLEIGSPKGDCELHLQYTDKRMVFIHT